MDLTKRLMQHLVYTDFEKLPASAIKATKHMILDTSAVILAGSSAKGSNAITQQIKSWSPPGKSTVLALGNRLTAPMAAWSNAFMGRARELDDSHDLTGDHSGLPAVSAALAVAEDVGNVTGKEIITAISLGVDLVARLRLACNIKVGQISWGAATFAPLSSAAVAGKLLQLDEGEMRSALGLAYSQLAGSLQAQLDGTLNLRVQHGLAVEAGVRSAFLAKSGMDGIQNFLEGRFGLYSSYFLDQWTPERIFNNLGKQFEIANVSIKRYPCGRYFHGAIDSVLEVIRNEGLAPEEIRNIRVKVSQNGYSMTCEPKALRLQPQNPFHASFSLFYCLATAAVRQKLFIEEFSEEAIQDEKNLSLARRVEPEVDDHLEHSRRAIPSTPIEIVTRDRGSFHHTTETPKGHPDNPMTFEEVFDKATTCATYSASSIPETNLQELKKAIIHLEDLNDISSIPSLLTGR